MAIPRVARIHLVYQFIILTLLIFVIGYNEILPDKKYLFLALIPAFCYQLMIVFCCTELLTIPDWLFLAEHPVESDIGQAPQNSGRKDFHSEKVLVENTESATKSPNLPKTKSPAHCPVKLPPKNSRTSTGSVFESSGSQESVSTRREMLTKPTAFCRAEVAETETTKDYYFPHRQKRPESWLEPKGSPRPYKVRNWKSLHSHKNPRPMSKPISMSVKLQEAKQETSNESDEANDLRKSYSFPFRQRKKVKWTESDENIDNNNIDIPIMSPWTNLDYSMSAKPVARRRKSVSTEAIDKQLRIINSREEETMNEFTQSLELSGSYNFHDADIKRNLAKPVTNFNKLKQGIVNCFNRNRKENSKADDTKQSVEAKRQFRESVSRILEDKESNTENMKSRESRVEKESRERLCNLSPSYISFQNDSFIKDEKANF